MIDARIAFAPHTPMEPVAPGVVASVTTPEAESVAVCDLFMAVGSGTQQHALAEEAAGELFGAVAQGLAAEALPASGLLALNTGGAAPSSEPGGASLAGAAQEIAAQEHSIKDLLTAYFTKATHMVSNAVPGMVTEKVLSYAVAFVAAGPLNTMLDADSTIHGAKHLGDMVAGQLVVDFPILTRPMAFLIHGLLGLIGDVA